MNNSTGHIANIGTFEYFIFNNGELFRAPLHNPVMTDGYRGGARWEAPAWAATAAVEQARKVEQTYR